MSYNIIFILYIIIFLSLCIVTAKNPVLAVILLIIIYLNTSIIFILLGAEFLGLLLIIVYVGAISVLFLFVVMLLNSRILELNSNINAYLSVLGFILSVFIFELVIIYFYNLDIFYCYLTENKLYDIWVYSYNWALDIQIIGQLLLNYYYIWLVVSGIILLLAMVGAISLTHENNIQKENNITNKNSLIKSYGFYNTN